MSTFYLILTIVVSLGIVWAFIISATLIYFHRQDKKLRPKVMNVKNTPDGNLVYDKQSFFFRVLAFTHSTDQRKTNWEKWVNICPNFWRFVYGITLYPIFHWPIRFSNYVEKWREEGRPRRFKPLTKEEAKDLRMEREAAKKQVEKTLKVIKWVTCPIWGPIYLVYLLIKHTIAIPLFVWCVPAGPTLWGDRKKSWYLGDDQRGYPFADIAACLMVYCIYLNGLVYAVARIMGWIQFSKGFDPRIFPVIIFWGINAVIVLIVAIITHGGITESHTYQILRAWARARHDQLCPTITFVD